MNNITSVNQVDRIKKALTLQRQFDSLFVFKLLIIICLCPHVTEVKRYE